MKLKQTGFTLLEAMIVIAILGILAALSYPSYQQYMIRTHRTDAKTFLMHIAAQQQRFFSNNNQYATSIAALGAAASSEYYNYGIAINNGQFTLTATPTGGQAGDSECANLVITGAGAKSISGSGDSTRCWGR